MLKPFLYVGVGSALGGMLRFLFANLSYYFWGRDFPYGTLLINLIGCFLIGFIFVFLLEVFHTQLQSLQALLITGFLGGFTTFSAFSFETVSLIENQFFLKALIYVLVSVVGGLIATATGLFLARWFL